MESSSYSAVRRSRNNSQMLEGLAFQLLSFHVITEASQNGGRDVIKAK